ncbi:MAG: helix-turn-helix transcriptional regulator [Desulfatiglandales bacterium]
MEDFLVENRIKKYRLALGIPQWKLALAAEIAESRMSTLEQGAPPREMERKKLAKVLNVHESDLWPEAQKD